MTPSAAGLLPEQSNGVAPVESMASFEDGAKPEFPFAGRGQSEGRSREAVRKGRKDFLKYFLQYKSSFGIVWT
ncbi:MAG: hypothetical protein ABSE16_01050 [Verrucomicrobiota bacterium]